MKRSTIVPLVLAVYLCVMAYIGYPDYVAGKTPALQYFGIIGITAVILVLLHFNLKRREKLRKERFEDIEKNNNSKK